MFCFTEHVRPFGKIIHRKVQTLTLIKTNIQIFTYKKNVSERFNIQIKKIQGFLDGKVCLDDLSIDKDVLEVLFVFRPELAPKPKVFIDDIWIEYKSKIETGQFDESDSMLILERPLPLPNIKIEDILSSLEKGPLVKEEIMSESKLVVKKIPKQNETNIFDLNQNNINSDTTAFPEANKRTEQTQSSRWQLWSVALVAASVLLILVPSLNSYESSSQHPSLSKVSEKPVLGNAIENKPNTSESTLEENSIVSTKKSKQSILERSSSPKSKKTETRKEKVIPNISTETLSENIEPRSSEEVFSEKKQTDFEVEIPLVSTNNEEDVKSELIITKDVGVPVTGTPDDALANNYNLDAGDTYEKSSTQRKRIEEKDVALKQKRRPSKRSRDDFVGKRRSKSSSHATDTEVSSFTEELIFEKSIARGEQEKVTEGNDVLEKQLEYQNRNSNVLMTIQIYNASDSLIISAADISFQYGTQNVIPYKSTEGLWIFSVPVNTVGKLVIGDMKSGEFLARDQHICKMVDQRLMCE